MKSMKTNTINYEEFDEWFEELVDKNGTTDV